MMKNIATIFNNNYKICASIQNQNNLKVDFFFFSFLFLRQLYSGIWMCM